MRRPQQLPRTATPAPERGAPAVREREGWSGPDARERPEAGDGPDTGSDVGETAPIVPLETAGGRRAPAPADTEGAGSAAAQESPLTSRDIWRAARARRRVLRAEIRRFTRASRRRRWVWLGAIGAVVALVAASVITAYSPLFAVERITVSGASVLEAAVIEDALSAQLGTPLALVDESAVKAALTTFPLIESYVLEAQPPHDLVVRIVERTPIGVVESGAGFTLLDAAGVVLATTPVRPEGQPLLQISGGVDSATFRSAGFVIRSLPSQVRERLTAVSADSPDAVTLRLGPSTTVMWGSAEDSGLKAAVLDAMMRAQPGARSYDVSSPEAGVVR